uniref:Uncharacterized protein n=1 Tax=Chlamydomonas leiostraca TaxID=1034604 RepID=A0A7S0X1J2_9CHLO|mmetsp:Transcript_9903/g.24760  ORF Transcript_9903/g.24760 Transcript_9903/m.24760 type:complete len:325 (+) Transcript_9903:205-1179(+)|eukprot:CAMPEP_0202860070 /NCGR_PEP_ID=MMETSP1391-20130828/1934_1 /ASSEMBLY_ACC=CAM_ASM_000867 /TAXON_ID=1034604 /ORGANISM="Chlamydomonas leiostraca, Strain SAG 11-49" /LENGTH=324 /DNA_ID=CAMNT_0049539203 /DNA_START=194 /DNA_END=1168 /DNA_ORIENTATION=+
MPVPVQDGYAQSNSGDTELYSEVLRAQTKSFYIDLKENARGRYVKVAEKGRYRPKSSIVIPVSGLPQFLVLLRYFLDEFSNGRAGTPRDVIIESKVFSFSAGSNDRGQFLRVFESGGGYPSGGSSLMIPSGWSNSYLKMFYGSLEKIAQQLSTDGSGFSLEQAVSNSQSLLAFGSPNSDNVVLENKEGGPVLSVGSKHFFFELRANERGHYLKVKEVSGNMKNLLVVPSHAIQKFQEAIGLALVQSPQQDHAPPANTHAGAGAPPQMQQQMPPRQVLHPQGMPMPPMKAHMGMGMPNGMNGGMPGGMNGGMPNGMPMQMPMAAM